VLDMTIDPATTALVLIDLQRGIVSRDTKPHAAADVIARCARLAKRFREIGATVVLVHVGYSADDRDRLQPMTDAPPAVSGPLPPDWSELVPELEQSPSDVVVLKRQWGAFYGTQLDLQLRRRGVKAIVIGGIATNFGVESTARDAWERNYQLIFVEDAMSGISADAHHFAIANIFPRLGIVRSTNDILGALP
jgi:nicotinamidase-related amidase